MMKRRLAGAAMAMLVAGLAVAGCGAGDKGATTTALGGPRLTKAQYIAAADKVCNTAKRKIEPAAARIRASANKTGRLTAAKMRAFLTQTSIPAYDAMVGDLNKLAPPTADEQTVDGIVAAFAGAVDTMKANLAKYSNNLTLNPFDDAQARATDYGMKVCGS
jgi:hypothetical protein